MDRPNVVPCPRASVQELNLDCEKGENKSIDVCCSLTRALAEAGDLSPFCPVSGRYCRLWSGE